jgi:hypothetical protein
MYELYSAAPSDLAFSNPGGLLCLTLLLLTAANALLAAGSAAELAAGLSSPLPLLLLPLPRLLLLLAWLGRLLLRPLRRLNRLSFSARSCNSSCNQKQAKTAIIVQLTSCRVTHSA